MALLGIILLMVGVSILAFAKEELEDAFSGDWMRFDEPQEPKVEMDNSEFDWGHNIKNYMDYE